MALPFCWTGLFPSEHCYFSRRCCSFHNSSKEVSVYRQRDELCNERKYIEEFYKKAVNHNREFEDLDVHFESDSDSETQDCVVTVIRIVIYT